MKSSQLIVESDSKILQSFKDEIKTISKKKVGFKAINYGLIIAKKFI